MKKIILFWILFVVLISGCSQQQASQIKNPQISLTLEKKEEVCKDIRAYLDYCYMTGIKAETCGEQIVEKTMRIYELTSNQVTEVLTYCDNGG